MHYYDQLQGKEKYLIFQSLPPPLVQHYVVQLSPWQMLLNLEKVWFMMGKIHGLLRCIGHFLLQVEYYVRIRPRRLFRFSKSLSMWRQLPKHCGIEESTKMMRQVCYYLISTHISIQKVKYEIILFLYNSILELISIILNTRIHVRRVLYMYVVY